MSTSDQTLARMQPGTVSISDEDVDMINESSVHGEAHLSPRPECRQHSLQDLPVEILEHIFSFLSPYRELDTAKLVSWQWNRVVKSVIRQMKRRFYQNLFKCEVCWSDLSRESPKGYPERGHIGISDRFSHSAVYHDGSMYIFGGCTSTNTTFNDLWRFDLTTRQWIRPIAMGTYPSPKACATMVVYNGKLVLFGGWSHPIPYPLHQAAHYFSELHVYSPVTNRWSHVLSLGQEPEALGGHSASVAGHLMVIFGGSPRPGLGTNNLWVFNFIKASWKLQPVCRDAKPEPRYGQFQTTLDEKHILIMGGCVGQNRVYNDLWLLTLHDTDPWQWTKLTIEHPELAAPQTWCHAACRVNNSIVVVARSSKVRQTRNVKKSRQGKHERRGSDRGNGATANNSPSSPEHSDRQLQQQPQCHCQQQRQQEQQQQQQQQHQFQFDVRQQELQQRGVFVHQQLRGDVAGEEDEEQNLGNHKNLLALQKRLHRDCNNLPDRDNHYHSGSQAQEEEAEGLFHRLNNKWGSSEAEASPRVSNQQLQPQQHDPDLSHHGQLEGQDAPQQRASSHNTDQPQFCNLPNAGSHFVSRGRGRGMPSIRPNASCNRQKQLEALQRQEELLRSKSRALAAARVPYQAVELSVEEVVPDFVTTRNHMDAHVLDISRVLTDGTAEWQPLSELQPVGAPSETICCSVLEGRGELILFGGVVRNLGNPVITNTAVNKLYLLHPK